MLARAAVVLLSSALAAATAVPSAQASHSWGGYHWARTANPFTLITGDNVDPAWDGYLDTVVRDWSQSNVLDLAEATGATTGRKCRATSGTIQVCNAAYGNNGWLGLATISITGGRHITQGTAKMNDSYFSMARYDNPNERLHVMCQEVGHTFGLGHTTEDGSSQNTCMDYFSNTGANATSTQSTHPNAHDYAELEEIYAHLDSTTTVRSSTTSSPTVGDDRASWGSEVHRAADGSHSVFVRDFGGGNRVVTHVTWALGREVPGRG
jgi:hypothetical protein